MNYVGRFAPSPTGPLHLGSLATAVASYLHARQASGRWLVRIEDIDPPREAPGASVAILRTLEAFELRWDGAVIYQSARRDRYDFVTNRLLREGSAFRCSCTRSDLRAESEGAASPYPGTCRAKMHHERSTAVRMRVDPGEPESFDDGVQGHVAASLASTTGDYVIRRRDGLPAYHLAVVLDDGAEHVTTVVRGVDLLDSTFVHLHLQRALGLPAPAYLHVPVIVGATGHKLSKQTGAVAVSGESPAPVAARVLELLGATVPDELHGAPPRELWDWAASNWRIEALHGRQRIPV